jgi:hypothetical protein
VNKSIKGNKNLQEGKDPEKAEQLTTMDTSLFAYLEDLHCEPDTCYGLEIQR